MIGGKYSLKKKKKKLIDEVWFDTMLANIEALEGCSSLTEMQPYLKNLIDMKNKYQDEQREKDYRRYFFRRAKQYQDIDPELSKEFYKAYKVT